MSSEISPELQDDVIHREKVTLYPKLIENIHYATFVALEKHRELNKKHKADQKKLKDFDDNLVNTNLARMTLEARLAVLAPESVLKAYIPMRKILDGNGAGVDALSVFLKLISVMRDDIELENLPSVELIKGVLYSS